MIPDDTDVFALLLHFLYTDHIKTNVFMQPTSAESDKVIHISATYQNHVKIAPNILAVHAASGCYSWKLRWNWKPKSSRTKHLLILLQI